MMSDAWWAGVVILVALGYCAMGYALALQRSSKREREAFKRGYDAATKERA